MVDFRETTDVVCLIQRMTMLGRPTNVVLAVFVDFRPRTKAMSFKENDSGGIQK